MRALLLDTHLWLWYAEGNERQLPPASIRRMDDARGKAGLLVSAISVWELGVLHARGRVQLTAPLRDWVAKSLDQPGITLAPLDADTAAESTLLPGDPHGDPADRFLIAAARVRGITLATRDRNILAYGGSGHVRVLGL
jgi:PIN domain nuclease of toxin-antitoxin system